MLRPIWERLQAEAPACRALTGLSRHRLGSVRLLAATQEINVIKSCHGQRLGLHKSSSCCALLFCSISMHRFSLATLPLSRDHGTMSLLAGSAACRLAPHRPAPRSAVQPVGVRPSLITQLRSIPQPRAQPVAHRCRPQRLSATGGGGGSGSGSTPPTALQQLVATPFYRIWLQLGVFLLLFMLVDAGFSRDWSRIGVITHEQEDALQQVGRARVAGGGAEMQCM